MSDDDMYTEPTPKSVLDIVIRMLQVLTPDSDGDSRTANPEPPRYNQFGIDRLMAIAKLYGCDLVMPEIADRDCSFHRIADEVEGDMS